MSEDEFSSADEGDFECLPPGVVLSSIPVAEKDTYEPHTCWEPPGDTFPVRGLQYMTDQRKYPAEACLGRLVMVDVFQSDSRCNNVTSWRKKVILEEAKKQGLWDGNEKYFIFTINMQLPGGPEVASYFIVLQETLDKHEKFAKLWKSFLSANDEFRSQRLKVIPSVVDGNMLVTRCVGKKPALIGKHIPTKQYVTEDYFEMDADITNSFVVRACVSVAKTYASSLVIDLGYVIEGSNPDELPEVILGCLRYVKLDFS
eukprot:Rmarinus@m.10183